MAKNILLTADNHPTPDLGLSGIVNLTLLSPKSEQGNTPNSPEGLTMGSRNDKGIHIWFSPLELIWPC